MRRILLALVAFALAGSATAREQVQRDAAAGRLLADRAAEVLRQADRSAEIGPVLDTLHGAAARADADAYFGLYTPDAVFIGTDVSERWTLAQFRAYAAPIFAQGRGWTYTLRPGTRHIAVAPDGRTAWFDEVLDSASYGTSRGTGVLVLTPQGWRIAQYHLTFPIPNDLAGEITARIRAHEARTPPAP